ncbi:MAG: hypothetical protein L0332_30915 [Chloroflexi bacterium]|nr:hypothetical protein [Chloroflexota bacterium]MCI0575465.1 hypothetical protein [Chloroflexota bacterium]MCI0648912.1 hypothetical protein [Chloroflexota bacterium]MCI0731112.1 hypothetical protein [Chloroflexota bacterium]
MDPIHVARLNRKVGLRDRDKNTGQQRRVDLIHPACRLVAAPPLPVTAACDLINHLANIIGFSELLRARMENSAVEEECQQYLAALERNAEQLLHMVHELQAGEPCPCTAQR